MIPGSFEYHRPGTVDEAVSLLDRYGGDGRIIAGGHSLVPMMKLRMAVPEHLIDLRDVADLRNIDDGGSEIIIGAMVTQAEIIGSAVLADKCPILAETALLIADPQVRYVGTIGGNAANGDPGNDMPAVMMALNATYVLRGPDGVRDVAARDFYHGAYDTARQDNELLTLIRLPMPLAGHGWAYQKLKRKVGDYATAATAVLLTMDGGTCASAVVTLTNLSDKPLLAEAAGDALVGSAVDAAAIAAAAEAAKAITEPIADLRGSAAYRTEMAGITTARAIESALARAAN